MAIQLAKDVVGGYSGDHWVAAAISVADYSQAATTPVTVLYVLYKDATEFGNGEPSVAAHRSPVIIDMTAITGVAGQFEQLVDDAAIADDPFFAGGSHV